MSAARKIPAYLPIGIDFISDRRIKRLNKDIPNCSGLGMVMGLYFYLSQEVDMKCNYDDIDIIADELRTSVPLLKTVIENYNLFQIEECEGKRFFSPYLNKILEPYYEKCETNRINAKIGAQKRKLKQQKQLEELKKLSQSNSSERPLTECSANRIEENITDDSIDWDKWNENQCLKQIAKDKKLDREKDLSEQNQEEIEF